MALAVAALPAAALPSSRLLAQGEDPALTEILRDQPPLTPEEISLEIEYIGFTKTNPSASSPEGAYLFGRGRGLTRERMTYVTVKCAAGYRLLSKGQASDRELEASLGSRLARPSPAELDLMRARRSELLAAFAAR
jgi:hypothetical protein